MAVAVTAVEETDARNRAVELLGPTVTLSTDAVFAAAGALQAMAHFVEALYDRGLALYPADISNLHEAMVEIAQGQVSSLLRPGGPELPDDDPRVVAGDMFLDEQEGRFAAELEQAFGEWTKARPDMPAETTKESLARISASLACIKKDLNEWDKTLAAFEQVA